MAESITLAALNALPEAQARARFGACCAAGRWAQAMTSQRPYSSIETLLAGARRAAGELQTEDWLQAFAAHPLIGDVELLKSRYAEAGERANAEQGQVLSATDAVIERLAELNRAYYDRHGFIFIVCASGRSAEAMLLELQARLPNRTEQELAIAAEEQKKITELRLYALLGHTP